MMPMALCAQTFVDLSHTPRTSLGGLPPETQCIDASHTPIHSFGGLPWTVVALDASHTPITSLGGASGVASGDSSGRPVQL